jgi:hypothetical protein
MSKAAANVREKFSLEFVTADAEVAALKGLLERVNELPDLVLFDPEAPVAAPAAVSAPEPFDGGSFADPVDELRMLFGSVQ